MWLQAVTVLWVTVDHIAATMLYGPCPHLLSNSYEDFRIKPFLDSAGEILYFSNVRYEVLFDGRTEYEELYHSKFAIILRQQDRCFLPFRLEKKDALIKFVTNRSFREGPRMTINVGLLVLHEPNYLLAFSCVQIGHGKLEYVWIFGRAGRAGIGLEKVRQLFGPWLANISTPYHELRRTHPELPFCKSIIWPAIVGGGVSLLLLLLMTSVVVYLKNHKQILQLRRSSCAEYPMEKQDPAPMELQVPEPERPERTSGNTVWVVHHGVDI